MIHLPKSQPAPICLKIEKNKVSGSYHCGDVLERLKNDFHNKCYICEVKEPTTINIEHFKPHKGDNELKFDWNNLFYCCGHCNNTKLAQSIFDDILNCTIADDLVDCNIKYFINPFPQEKAIITAVGNTDRINNTVILLNEIYNGTTELKKIESANIRTKLLLEIRKFQNLLFEYYDDNFNKEEKKEIKDQIIRQLRPTSNFTAFKKWIIRENKILNEEFNQYL